MTLMDLSDADRLAILEDPAHPDHDRLIDELDGHVDDGMGPDEHAPYGYMIDETTKEKRPKKRPGRQQVRRPAPAVLTVPAAPEPDVVDVEFTEERAPIERTPDRAPATRPKRGRRGAKGGGAAAPLPPEKKETIPFRAGPIARGMNKGYRKCGKIVRVANKPLGQALIDITRKEDDDDITVGEAWEELARNHPAIRGALMKLVDGGNVLTLLVVHLPVIVALLMLDPIASRLPIGPLLQALMSDDDNEGQDEEGGEDFPSFPLGGLLAGMSQADLAQALAFAQQMGDQVGQRAAGAVRRGGEG